MHWISGILIQMLMAAGESNGVNQCNFLQGTLGQETVKAEGSRKQPVLRVIIYVVCLAIWHLWRRVYFISDRRCIILEMGVSYLWICCVISFSNHLSLFEKLLQAIRDVFFILQSVRWLEQL